MAHRLVHYSSLGWRVIKKKKMPGEPWRKSGQGVQGRLVPRQHADNWRSWILTRAAPSSVNPDAQGEVRTGVPRSSGTALP